jgi:hypothetical protein
MYEVDVSLFRFPPNNMRWCVDVFWNREKIVESKSFKEKDEAKNYAAALLKKYNATMLPEQSS